MSRVGILVAILAATVVLAGCKHQPPTNQASGAAANTQADVPEPPAIRAAAASECRLTMGWHPYEPYHYGDIGGEVRGLDIELVAGIARQAGCRIRFVQGNWTELLERVRVGEIDLVSGATRTEEREKYAYFSNPYRQERFRLYVREGQASVISGDSLQEILGTGTRIGTTKDFLYGSPVDELQKDPRYAEQFFPVAISEVNYSELVSGNIDLFVEDSFVAASILRRKGLADKIDEHPLIVYSGDVHLMLSRASIDTDTVERINQALLRLRESGTYDRIIDRYLD